MTMRTIFACFNFIGDLAAEEKNYLDVHVELAKHLPGLRQYITGKLRPSGTTAPAYYRAAVLNYDSKEAAREANRNSAVAKPLMDDSAAHISPGARWIELESEVIVPFDSRKPGQDYFVMAAEFDLKLNCDSLDSAEKLYLDHHTHIARRLPGLRHYLIGQIDHVGRGGNLDRWRMAMLVFDNIEAFRAAYRSPVGQELIKDEESTILNPRVYRLDAKVQI
jgi:uncharacterized protein (TIGR02118 family)